PARQALPAPMLRHALAGIAMGLTAISLIYSPWGQQSGAHLNPATTLTFWRLGKVRAHDALFYALAQFAGAILGVQLAAAALGTILAHRAVRYAVTQPGDMRFALAFLAEAGISFGLMTLVLRLTNHERLAPYTGLFAGALVALYITFEAPL